MSDTHSSYAYLLPYSADLISYSAQQMIQDNLASLPNLSQCIVLLPNYQVASTLRREVLKAASVQGHTTLIGPKVFLFRDYILKNTLVNSQQLPPIAAELLIIQSLSENKALFGENNTLNSSYALLDLINELTRHQVVLPSNFLAFKKQLLKAYETQSKEFDALSQEAKLVFTIWQAWHTQMQDLKKADKETLYQLKLGQNHNQSKDLNFYLLGTQNFLPSEIRWIQQKLNAGKIKIFTQCETEAREVHPDTFSNNMLKKLNIKSIFPSNKDQKSQLISLIYNKNTAILKERISIARQQFPKSPIKNLITLYKGNAFEEEANAIQIQIRRWLEEGKKDIAFISEDRRLARRVRALLERYGIGLYDSEGWALSTSSTASVIESLLEAIEENFNHTALLTLLKSHFIFPQDKISRKASDKLEQELVHHEKIYNDITRYKNAAISRQKRLNIENNEETTHLFSMLDTLDVSSKNLQELHQRQHFKVSSFINSLFECIEKLNAKENLLNDSAGKVILELMQNILSATENCDTTLSWTETRQWFAKKLEESTFTVNNAFKTQINYLHLHQSNLTQHEAIIFGSVTREHLPGSLKKSPFFNQQVYQELGLSNSHEPLQERFFYFRRLLDSAQKVCLTYHSGEQESQPSPWLELLNNFHQLAYGEDLTDPILNELVAQQTINPPSKNENHTTFASIKPLQMPKKISASAHQSLIDCPYSYFLGEVIKLRAPEEVRTTLAKSDYGERIHFILFLFHQGQDEKFPAPFTEPLTSSNRNAAIKRMEEISKQVFHYDLEDNFQHRGWLKRWLDTIPFYIDWQIHEQAFWRFSQGEISSSSTLVNGISAHGRLDRIDTNAKSSRIIDYKTGSYPKKADIESGESVQLAHYALSYKNKTGELAYLSLDNKGKPIVTDTILDEENLTFIQHAIEKRLINILDQIKNGESMSAWGDDKTCSYCQFSGICRERLD